MDFEREWQARDENGRPTVDAVGESVRRQQRLNLPTPGFCPWPDFNAESYDALPNLKPPTLREDWRTHLRAAGAVATPGATIEHRQGRR